MSEEETEAKVCARNSLLFYFIESEENITINFSAFIFGIRPSRKITFWSGSEQRKITWKSMYFSRFAPRWILLRVPICIWVSFYTLACLRLSVPCRSTKAGLCFGNEKYVYKRDCWHGQKSARDGVKEHLHSSWFSVSIADKWKLMRDSPHNFSLVIWM